jgi:hypothetical protein
MQADRWGNAYSADVVHQGRTLGAIFYTGPTRGPLVVRTEVTGQVLLAKLVDINGYVKKRAQFRLDASRGMLR